MNTATDATGAADSTGADRNGGKKCGSEPQSTRAGGQDDGSYTNSLKLEFGCRCYNFGVLGVGGLMRDSFGVEIGVAGVRLGGLCGSLGAPRRNLGSYNLRELV